MIHQSTLPEWCESFAQQVSGTVSRKGAAFVISLGEGWCIVEPIPDFSPTWAKLELIYPPGVVKDCRTGPTVETFDFQRTRGFDLWRKVCGKLSLYQDDLRKANYRRGSRETILDDAGDLERNGLALQQRVPLGEATRGSDGRQADDDRREGAVVHALGQESAAGSAGATGEELRIVPATLPGSVGVEAVGLPIVDERKRRRLNGQAKNRTQRVARELAERRAGLSQFAPPKIGRQPMAFQYVRWSDSRQAKGTSEEQQTGEMDRVYDQKYAKDFVKAPLPYVDAGVSSKWVPFLKRDMARQLLADVQAGDLILAHRGDRLFRSLKDTISTMDLLHGMGVRLCLADSSMQTDWGTPSGKLIFSILGAVSEYDNELRSARVKEAKRIRAAQGLTNGGSSCPAFCERVWWRKRKIVVLRPVYVDLVEWCAESLRSGWSNREVCLEASKRAAVIEGKKPAIGETYGFAVDTLKRGLARNLMAWQRETARKIRYAPFGKPEEIRYVWMPKKKAEVEA